MAQPISVSPIEMGGNEGIRYFGESLAFVAQQKAAREKALREAVLNQKKANDKIFGDTTELLARYHSNADNAPTQVRDQYFNQGIQELSKYANSPEFPKLASLVAAEAYKNMSGWDAYYKQTNEIAKQFATKDGGDFDEKKIKALAEKYREGKSLDKLGDYTTDITNEIVSHPELYIDPYKLTSGAYADLDKMAGKPEKGGQKTSLDPTGMKESTLGTEYTTSMFDRLNPKQDPLTGMKYSQPSLSVEPSAIAKPSGGAYEALTDDKFQMLKSYSPSISRKLMIGALEKIRNHNAEVFKSAGVKNPEDMALSVSKNNVSQFEKIKGFVNPFDEASLDQFERSYAVDFIKGTGRYNEDLTTKDFKLDQKVKADNPRIPKTEKQVGDETYVKAFNEMLDITKANQGRGETYTSLVDLPDFAQNAVMSQARNTVDKDVTASDIKLRENAGDVWIVAAKDIVRDDEVKKKKDEPIVRLTKAAIDIKASKPLGTKAVKAAATEAEKEKQAKKKYNPQTGKYE